MTDSTNSMTARRRRLPWLMLGALVAAVLFGAGALGTYSLRPDVLLHGEFERQAWSADVTKREVVVDDHRWVFFERGESESPRSVPLLLLHGFTGSKENWLPLLAELDDVVPVIVPDLPGWGESTRHEDADYGIDAQVSRLRRFLDARRIERVELVGHSMGGHIAGVFAARHPERVAALTLIDSAGVRFEPNAFARRVLAGETPFNVSTRTGFDTFMSELFAAPPWLPPRLKDVLIERSIAGRAFHARTLAAVGKGEAAFELERSLADIHAQTLVLWCRDDRILDVSSTRVFARMQPRATITVLDDCGHMAMMEQPAAVAAALRTHFERTGIVVQNSGKTRLYFQ